MSSHVNTAELKPGGIVDIGKIVSVKDIRKILIEFEGDYWWVSYWQITVVDTWNAFIIR